MTEAPPLPPLGEFSRRIRYLAWAAQKKLRDNDQLCPACRRHATFLRRKFVILSLMECKSCGLRFRLPKDDPDAAAYYDTSYSVDYPAQRPPAPESLGDLTRTGVLDHPANRYAKYAEVVKAAGVKSGDSVVDFGCSWGYGSWQLRQTGFKVYSLEISYPRAAYARANLGCTIVEDTSQIPEPVDCFFSAHVIEHLQDPTLIWREADKILGIGGKIIIFCPNGEPKREAIIGRKAYDYLWPQVHPMVITPRFMRTISEEYGFCAKFYSEPYDLAAIASGREPSDLFGDELLLIAERH